MDRISGQLAKVPIMNFTFESTDFSQATALSPLPFLALIRFHYMRISPS